MIPNDYETVRALHLAAGECLQNGDYAGALQNLGRAMDLLPETAKKARAILFNNMGHTQVALEDYDGALQSFRNAALLFQKTHEKIGWGEQLGNIGSVHRDMKHWDESLDAYFQALAVFQEENHESGIADQYSNIAYAFSRKGEAREAFTNFTKAKKLYDKLGDREKSLLCEQNLQTIGADTED